jgi:hypothetical protein
MGYSCIGIGNTIPDYFVVCIAGATIHRIENLFIGLPIPPM